MDGRRWKVVGRVPWATRVRETARYLVLAAVDDKGGLVVDPTSVYELDGEGPAKRLDALPDGDERRTLPAQAFLNEIRSAV
jgi:hypothetical protein